METLIKEIVAYIFSFLDDYSQLSTAQLVCKRWNQIAKSDRNLLNIMESKSSKFDQKNLGKTLSLSDDCKQVSCTSDVWRTAALRFPFRHPNMIDYVEFRMEELNASAYNSWKCVIGVVGGNVATRSLQKVEGFGYIAGNGGFMIDGAGDSVEYGEPYGSGDIIGILVCAVPSSSVNQVESQDVDPDNVKDVQVKAINISFFLNGVWKGVAQQISNRKLFAFVSLAAEGTIVEVIPKIMERSKWPSYVKKVVDENIDNVRGQDPKITRKRGTHDDE